jgi:hypothetical protein
MRSSLVLFLLVALAACGDRSAVAADEVTRTPCRPPAELVAMVTSKTFSPASMRSALLHSAGPMNSALTQSRDVRDLQDAIRIVATHIEASDYDGACRLLTIAGGLLSRLPANPATLSDRDGIRLILALTAQSLAEVLPK